ncbi:MAG TPA: glycosyltransferase [Candidatus Bilamarchaeum sp.]|nr:glycosyltransferase [Candidatus Bilamarchaeum sp.]
MLTFVIPTYNEEAHIGRLLAKLTPQLQKGDEIVVVDSHSKDGTVKIAKKFGCRIVMQPKNGNGLARTAGAKKAKNDIVVFVDADSVPSDDFAPRLRKHFSEEGLLAVGGLDLYHSDSKTWKFIYDTFSRSIFYSAWLAHSLTGRYWLASNNCAFRKHVFLRAGGYRSVICEDTDLTSRLPPSKNVKYDSRLKLSLSDRRFKKDGFFRTLRLWAWGNMTAAMGKGVDSSGYRKG